MLAVSHLNVPVGTAVLSDQLATALRAGSTRDIPAPSAAALILSLFNELTPNLILLCAAEAGADVQHVNQLYREALADAFPPAPVWENAVRAFL